MNRKQALILCKLINKETDLKTSHPLSCSFGWECGWGDMVTLTQVGAIKMTKGGLSITTSGKKRFLKFVKKEGYPST